MVDHKQNAESDQKNGGWRLILSGSSSGHSGGVHSAYTARRCRRADKSDKKLRTATGRARVCRDNCTALAINYRPPRCRSPRDRWLCVLPVAANGRRYLICITPTFSTGTTGVEHIKINDQKSRSRCHDAARPPATGRPPPGTDSGRFTARSSARRVRAIVSASAPSRPRWSLRGPLASGRPRDAFKLARRAASSLSSYRCSRFTRVVP